MQVKDTLKDTKFTKSVVYPRNSAEARPYPLSRTEIKQRVAKTQGDQQSPLMKTPLIQTAQLGDSDAIDENEEYMVNSMVIP